MSTNQKPDKYTFRLGVCMAVITLVAVMLFGGGCSTIAGAADLLSGVAQDIRDAADGTRAHMTE